MFPTIRNEGPPAEVSHPYKTYWLPEFLDEDVRNFKSEYNFEWKRYLLKSNSNEIKTWASSKERFTFYKPKIVQCVFNICQMLQQPPEVRYLAIDVLDRFLVEHFFNLREAFEKDQRLDNWETIIERMLNHSPLRILTCIQLAMKFSWSCNIISASTIQEIMKNFGEDGHYSKKNILRSEARIYKSLNYNIPSKTPLLYLEMFFDDFQKHEYFSVKISLHSFFITCIQVLDVAIIHHQQIYFDFVQLLRASCEESSSADSHVVALKADFVMLAASVVFASSVLKYPSKEMSKMVLRTLCTVGECEVSQIQGLGKQLLNILYY